MQYVKNISFILLSIVTLLFKPDKPKMLFEIDIAELTRLGIVDGSIAFFVGGVRAGFAGFATGALAFYMTRDRVTSVLIGLGGVALYETVSCKLGMGEKQNKKMFER